MREVSHLITIFSKSSQSFDVLPFHGMCQFEKLKLSLSKARDELKSGKAPKSEIFQSPHRKPFQLWQDFNDCIDILLKHQTFFGFKVLLPCCRVTRSGSVFDCDPSSYSQLVKSCFVKYSSYIEILLFNLYCRFVPWPTWVVLCNSCFNFHYTVSDEERKLSFEKLLEEKSSAVPLKSDEKERLKAEYVTLQINASMIAKQPEVKTPEAFWYELLTIEQYYKTCINVNEFALRFLTRTFNECSVELQVSTINSVDTSSRRLKHEMAEMLTFISTNGPYPLASLNVIEDALNRHFKEKQWHFVLSNSQHYSSKVVDRQIKESADMANELA